MIWCSAPEPAYVRVVLLILTHNYIWETQLWSKIFLQTNMWIRREAFGCHSIYFKLIVSLLKSYSTSTGKIVYLGVRIYRVIQQVGKLSSDGLSVKAGMEKARGRCRQVRENPGCYRQPFEDPELV